MSLWISLASVLFTCSLCKQNPGQDCYLCSPWKPYLTNKLQVKHYLVSNAITEGKVPLILSGHVIHFALRIRVLVYSNSLFVGGQGLEHRKQTD